MAWHVYFQVLNNFENAASLNNLMLREGFQSASKWKTRSSYLGEQNSTSSIETRHTKLDKAVCICCIFSYLEIKEKKSVDFFNPKQMNISKFTIYTS